MAVAAVRKEQPLHTQRVRRQRVAERGGAEAILKRATGGGRGGEDGYVDIKMMVDEQGGFKFVRAAADGGAGGGDDEDDEYEY